MGENARRPSVRHTPLHRCIALCSGASAMCGRCWFSCIYEEEATRGGASLSEAYTVGGEERVHRLVAMLQGRCLRRAWLRKEDEDVSRIRGRSVQKERPSKQAKQAKRKRKRASSNGKQQQKKRDRRDACSQKFALAFHRKVAFGCTALPLRCHCAATVLQSRLGPPTAVECSLWPPLRDGTHLSRFWQRRVAISDRRSPAPATIRTSIAQPHHRHSLHAPRQHPSSCSPPATRSPTLSFALSHRGAHRFTRFGPTLFPSLHPAVCTSSSQWRAIVLRP